MFSEMDIQKEINDEESDLGKYISICECIFINGDCKISNQLINF